MSALLNLQNALHLALEPMPQRPDVPASLIQEIDTLKRLLLGAGAGPPPRDLLHEAVRQFRDTGELPNLGVARSVCYGSTVRFGMTEPPLIEGAIFRRLLEMVDQYVEEPRPFRRCYRGLLHSYFIYDHQEAPEIGQSNWARLRSYLEQRRQSIYTNGVRPDWVESLDDHPNLLSSDPVSKYGSELLEGRTEGVDRWRRNLEIDHASWLIKKLILAQIETATRERDDGFRQLVEPLLKLLSGHPLLEDEGLKLMLDRYARITAPELHAGLRDRAVEQWGSPWIERKRDNWTRVSPQAKQLITTWLKLDLIREFFEALSEDRQTDRRRLEFWQQYHEQISDMYFALGPNVLSARDADMRRLREKMADHLLTLSAGGGTHNNAFIMMLGTYTVVEFGTKGNACFVFESQSRPFALRGNVAGDKSGLKHETCKHRLLHMDSGGATWEYKFRQVLSHCGVQPETVSGRSKAFVSESALTDRGGGKAAKGKFLAFLNDNGILWEDKTAKGGNLKVLHARFTGSIGEQLKKWGFAYSERQFWYRRDWP